MDAVLKIILPYFFCSLAAYLAGAVNFAWIVARKKGIDIQHKGSGNPGTTNVGRVMGLSAAAVVFVGDVLKAAAMVFAARFLFSDSPGIGEVTTLACVLGHMYPFYLDFKGGKGVAVLLGASLGTDWQVFFLLIAVLLVIAFLSDHLFLGNLSAAAGFWLWSFLSGKRPMELLALFIAVGLSFWKHRGNFARLFAGQEKSLRASVRDKINARKNKK
ncbi:MAG: glycerol-3-phosphate acyltransferase [Clostridia bacterium]|nr:glycerol-3-phosphate acyltransferase [Clostridia bacterium]